MIKVEKLLENAVCSWMLHRLHSTCCKNEVKHVALPSIFSLWSACSEFVFVMNSDKNPPQYQCVFLPVESVFDTLHFFVNQASALGHWTSQTFSVDLSGYAAVPASSDVFQFIYSFFSFWPTQSPCHLLSKSKFCKPRWKTVSLTTTEISTRSLCLLG